MVQLPPAEWNLRRPRHKGLDLRARPSYRHGKEGIDLERTIVTELVPEDGLPSADELNDILAPEHVTRPRRFRSKGHAEG